MQRLVLSSFRLKLKTNLIVVDIKVSANNIKGDFKVKKRFEISKQL